MNRSLSSFFLLLEIMSCTPKKDRAERTEVDPKYTYIVTQSPKGGWGYQIYKDSTLFIDQPTIPAIGGGLEFETLQDANRIAELVVSKLQTRKIGLPTVSIHELDSLQVTH